MKKRVISPYFEDETYHKLFILCSFILILSLFSAAFIHGNEISISIQEESLNDTATRVIVSSDSHVDAPVEVLLNVSEREGTIKVYWENTQTFLPFTSYDLDNDGLIDQIAWTVPHLSTQEFIISLSSQSSVGAQANPEITLVDVPGIITGDEIDFELEVSHFNPEQLICSFNVMQESSVVISESIQPNATSSFSHSLSNGNYSWKIVCEDATNSSASDFREGNLEVNVDYTPTITFSNLGTVDEDQEYTYELTIEPIVESGVSAIVDFEQEVVSYGEQATSLFTKNIPFTYDESGTYQINVTAIVDDVHYSVFRTITVNEVTSSDDTKPTITLKKPNDNVQISLNATNNEINFTYEATDNVKVDSCQFEIYYSEEDDTVKEIVDLGSYGENTSVVHNKVSLLTLRNFDEGFYTWFVSCEDNSSNEAEVDRDFEVIFTNSSSAKLNTNSNSGSLTTLEEHEEHIEEIEEIVDKINDFLIKEESYDKEVRDAISDMGLIERIKGHKKRMLQMKIDLQHNLEYIRNEDERDERFQAILDEIAAVGKDVPLSVEVTSSQEFSKNSLGDDVALGVEAYIDAKNLVVDRRGTEALILTNEELQNHISISTVGRELTITYDDSSKRGILVTKTITAENASSIDSYLEMVPETYGEATSFEIRNEYGVIQDKPGIFQVRKNDLVDNKIIYFIPTSSGLASLEESSTLAFRESASPSSINALSGLVTFGRDGQGIGFYLSWILVIVLVVGGGIMGYRKYAVTKFKKDDTVKEILSLLKEAQKSLDDKDVADAREQYRTMHELYEHVSEQAKPYIFKKIQSLYQEINKTDIKELVTEFIVAVKERRKDDALYLYQDITSLYPLMPPRFKQKVYDKMRTPLRKLQKM